jgi:AcrR family transcriptional regulator
MENMSNQEIASAVGVTKGTVDNYFSSNEMDKFKRFYSDQELFKLQQSVEQDLSHAESIAKEALGEAKRKAETSSDYRRVAETAFKICERKINLLQEIGALDKTEDSSNDADTEQLRQELVAGLKEKRQELKGSE